MQKLENLEITKVAFVPEGDNKKADVLLFKSKPEPATPPASDDGGTEANVMKRVLLAFAKALGFDINESTETKKAPQRILFLKNTVTPLIFPTLLSASLQS